MKYLLILLPLLLSAKYIDLGTEGHLYPIKEKDFLKELKTELENYEKSLTKDKIKTMISKQIQNQAIGKTDLPYCQNNNKEISLNEYTVPQNIINPAGRIIYKKGQKVILNNKYPLNICFISGDDNKIIDKQIKFYDKITKKLGGQDCVYMVSNKNVLELDKKYKPKMFYPSNKNYEKTYNVSCYPTLIHLEGRKLYKFELPITFFKNGGE